MYDILTRRPQRVWTWAHHRMESFDWMIVLPSRLDRISQCIVAPLRLDMTK